MSAELQKLLDAATPGPWRVGQEGSLRVYGPDGEGCHSGLIFDVWTGKAFKGRANADLIAQAPTLAARVIAAEKVVEALRLALDCHGSMLLTDPPQDAWKARDVSRIGHAALAAYDEVPK